MLFRFTTISTFICGLRNDKPSPIPLLIGTVVSVWACAWVIIPPRPSLFVVVVVVMSYSAL